MQRLVPSTTVTWSGNELTATDVDLRLYFQKGCSFGYKPAASTRMSNEEYMVKDVEEQTVRLEKGAISSVEYELRLASGDSVMCKVKAAGASYVEVVTTDQQAPNVKAVTLCGCFYQGISGTLIGKYSTSSEKY